MNDKDARIDWACLFQATLGTMMVLVFSANLGAQTGPNNEPQDQASEVRRVLLVTGEDYPGHKWKQTAPVLKAQLARDRRLVVVVTEDLRFLRTPGLPGFDTVVMHFKNYDPAVPGREGFGNLQQFVREGGGLVLVHFACGAFQEFKPEFSTVAGRAWNPDLRGHDPHGKFRVHMVEASHPITRQLSSFETTDELYTCLEGATPITVLADAQSKVDGKRYPMAFVLHCGEGRVFHCLLGHDADSLRVPAVGELYRRGCAWTARLQPARPMAAGPLAPQEESK